MLLHNFYIFLSLFHLSFSLAASFQSPPRMLVSVDNLQHFIQTIHTNTTECQGLDVAALRWSGDHMLSHIQSSPERGLGVVGAEGLGRGRRETGSGKNEGREKVPRSGAVCTVRIVCERLGEGRAPLGSSPSTGPCLSSGPISHTHEHSRQPLPGRNQPCNVQILIKMGGKPSASPWLTQAHPSGGIQCVRVKFVTWSFGEHCMSCDKVFVKTRLHTSATR